MSSAPEFGVVILNWNNAEDTLVCLTSLRSADPLPRYAVVVDNGSVDSSLADIRGWGREQNVTGEDGVRPWLTVIEAGANRGFAGGTNLGIRYLGNISEVTHILLLNNDATITPRFFTDIANAIARCPDAGLIGPTILETGDGWDVWYAGGVEHPLRALYTHSYEVPGSDEPVPTDFVTGCAMVISRALLERIGPLAECYFPAYWEDGEYSFRARHAGFPVVYAPAARVYHKVGATVRAAGLDLVLARAKNRLRVFYVRRNYRGWTKVMACAYLAVTKPGRAAIEAIKGRPRLGLAILEGTFTGFISREAHR